MSLSCGIDVGSTTTKIVVLNGAKQIVYSDTILTAGDVKSASETIFEKCLKTLNADRGRMDRVTSTGYGRKYVDFADKNITEISCFAKGANYLDPQVRTVIDIGGQDSKVIAIGPSGEVNDFVMNDKCAAGTGRFLEMTARTFNVKVSQLGEIASCSTRIVPISSICAVFAESEAISLIAQGVKREDIINSIHNSIGERIHGLASRLPIQKKLMFCGGVAANMGMVHTVCRIFHVEELVMPENVTTVGALGAALFGISL
jgi:predicted CoA-substrate-specific enzyme activase